MTPPLEADILAASQPLRVPGAGERRVLSPGAVAGLSERSGSPRWELEAAALEADVVPLHYLRNIAQFGMAGQVRLLRARAVVVGTGPVLERALERLATSGVGRIMVLAPCVLAEDEPRMQRAAERLAGVAVNRNAGTTVTARTLRLRGGNPAEELGEADAVGASLEAAMDEQLLQFACRMAKLPLTLAAAEEGRAHATTVLPGDAGAALVYKPTHPHLSSTRSVSEIRPQAALVAGAWLAGQMTALLLGEGELLRGRLVYADAEQGEVAEYPL